MKRIDQESSKQLRILNSSNENEKNHLTMLKTRSSLKQQKQSDLLNSQQEKSFNDQNSRIDFFLYKINEN